VQSRDLKKELIAFALPKMISKKRK